MYNVHIRAGQSRECGKARGAMLCFNHVYELQVGDADACVACANALMLTFFHALNMYAIYATLPVPVPLPFHVVAACVCMNIERGEILIKYVVCFEYIGSVNVTTTNISFVVLYVNLFEFIAYLYSVHAACSTTPPLFFPRSVALLLLLFPFRV